MEEETHYFYSADGTDTMGPVTHDEFCQLIRDKVIGEGSFFCYEGENEWRSLDPDAFVRPSHTTRLPPYEPPPYVPPPDARARDEERAEKLSAAWDEPGPHPTLLAWVGWILALGGAAGLQKVRHGADGIIGDVGSFIVIAVIPYLISRLFPSVWRLRACVIGIGVVTALTIFGQLRYDAPADSPPATTPDAAK